MIKKIYRSGMHCRSLMISSEGEKRKRQSSKREGEFKHLTFTSIDCNRDEQKQRTMIDSGHRRQITQQVNL